MTEFPSIVGILGWASSLLFWATVMLLAHVALKWLNGKESEKEREAASGRQPLKPDNSMKQKENAPGKEASPL